MKLIQDLICLYKPELDLNEILKDLFLLTTSIVDKCDVLFETKDQEMNFTTMNQLLEKLELLTVFKKNYYSNLIKNDYLSLLTLTLQVIKKNN